MKPMTKLIAKSQDFAFHMATKVPGLNAADQEVFARHFITEMNTGSGHVAVAKDVAEYVAKAHALTTMNDAAGLTETALSILDADPDADLSALKAEVISHRSKAVNSALSGSSFTGISGKVSGAGNGESIHDRFRRNLGPSAEERHSLKEAEAEQPLESFMAKLRVKRGE